jgi:hypothetical protein
VDGAPVARALRLVAAAMVAEPTTRTALGELLARRRPTVALPSAAADAAERRGGRCRGRCRGRHPSGGGSDGPGLCRGGRRRRCRCKRARSAALVPLPSAFRARLARARRTPLPGASPREQLV